MQQGLDREAVLLVDDDELFAQTLARALARRGYRPLVVLEGSAARRLAARERPAQVVLDLRLGEDSGLELLPDLLQAAPGCRVVVLTGYASIATAVEAIKLGAVDYLTKPVGADDVLAALQREGADPAVPIAEQPMSVERLAWEHIQQVLALTGGNVSEAARRLGMHRRTLQRRLQKRPRRR